MLFTEFSANRIASITIDGVVSESQEFVHSAPIGITAIWLTPNSAASFRSTSLCPGFRFPLRIASRMLAATWLRKGTGGSIFLSENATSYHV